MCVIVLLYIIYIMQIYEPNCISLLKISLVILHCGLIMFCCNLSYLYNTVSTFQLFCCSTLITDFFINLFIVLPFACPNIPVEYFLSILNDLNKLLMYYSSQTSLEEIPTFPLLFELNTFEA